MPPSTEAPLSERPPRSSLAMAPADRERFLMEARIAVVAHTREDGAPAVSPVWYVYEPGGAVTFVTGAGTEKARRLRVAPAVTVLVHDEQPPQRFVTVSGTAAVVLGARDHVRRAIAARYLEPPAVDGFLAMTPAEVLVTVSVVPETWRSSDFGRIEMPATEIPDADASGNESR